MKYAAITVTTALLFTAPVFAGGLFESDDCRYTAPRNASTPAAGITRVVIHAEAGSLEVNGVANAGQVGVTGAACTSDEDFVERMTLRLRKIGTELHIDTHIPEKTVFLGFFSARLDFAVTLPAGLPVVIDDGSGWMKVNNVGATTIHDDSGSIEVRNGRGSLSIHDESGAIEVDGIDGDVTIDDDSGEIVVRNVSGQVEIEDDSGAIEVARVGSLHVRSDDSGAITAHEVRHDVLIDDDGSGAVTVADVAGNFTVHHKGSGSIDFVRVTGKVDIPDRRRD
jgi:hypothetical protein